MNILILGATSAMAIETARLYAAQSAKLFLVGRDAAKLTAIRDDLKARGAEMVGTRALDLNELEAHPELVAEAKAAIGALDVALIAHGILGDQEQAQMDWAQAELSFRTNFLSAASLLTVLANDFQARGVGVIAVITSVAGDRGRMSNYVYGAAKGGLSLFCQGLRNRLQHSGVHVVTIKPGFVATPMTAHLKQGPLFVGPQTIAKGVVRAIEKRRDVVYLPGFWRLIMTVIKLIPERLFKRLTL